MTTDHAAVVCVAILCFQLGALQILWISLFYIQPLFLPSAFSLFNAFLKSGHATEKYSGWWWISVHLNWIYIPQFGLVL